jgi:hypothetical protein
MCRGNVRVLQLLWQVRMARHSTQGLEVDLGADPLKGRRGLRIIGIDVGPHIIKLVVFCITSAIFSNFEHFIIYVILCNSRTHVITLLFGLCM